MGWPILSRSFPKYPISLQEFIRKLNAPEKSNRRHCWTTLTNKQQKKLNNSTTFINGSRAKEHVERQVLCDTILESKKLRSNSFFREDLKRRGWWYVGWFQMRMVDAGRFWGAKAFLEQPQWARCETWVWGSERKLVQGKFELFRRIIAVKEKFCSNSKSTPQKALQFSVAFRKTI